MEAIGDNILEIHNLKFGYNQNELILDNISHVFQRGKVYAILGAMASGKSTLLKLIAGLLKPLSGDILIDGRSISDIPEIELRKQIGIAFQYPDRSIFALSVFEEVSFAFKMLYPDRKHMLDVVVRDATNIVGLNESFLTRNPHFLSGGEKRKVALASAMVHSPSILLLDEPTAGLDGYSSRQILSFIREYAKKNKVVLFTTHHMENTYYADEVLVLYAGSLYSVSPNDIDQMLKFGLMPPEEILYRLWGKYYGFE